MRVAIYCRLSEEDRNKISDTDDSQSIQNQKSMLVNYAISQEWKIYDLYSDDDYTGADRRRPEFNRLLIDAENKKFDIILCKSQSRFTREIEIVEKYIHGYFIYWGIRFVSIVDNADTNNVENKKSRQINGLLNEWYLEDLSKNIKCVLADRRRQGKFTGSYAPYGYLKDPEDKGHLIVDSEAAEIVKEIFNYYIHGFGKTGIARILNEKGIPNPTTYKIQKGLRKRTASNAKGKIWKYYSINDILKNEVYIGNMVQGKYGSIDYKSKQNKPKPKEEWVRVENTHEPVIDVETWEAAQRLLIARYKPFKQGTVGLFAKKAKCMECGYTMCSSKTQDRYYLKCTTKNFNPDSCKGAFISVNLLEEIVLEELHNLIGQYCNHEKVEKHIKISNPLVNRVQTLEKENGIYKKRIEEFRNGLKELYFDKVKGIITENDYIEFSKNFNKDKSDLEQLIQSNEVKIQEMRNKLSTVKNKKEIEKKYLNIDKLSRVVVEELIEAIYVSKKDPVTKERNIEIHWKF